MEHLLAVFKKCWVRISDMRSCVKSLLASVFQGIRMEEWSNKSTVDTLVYTIDGNCVFSEDSRSAARFLAQS